MADNIKAGHQVTLYVRVWIEIHEAYMKMQDTLSHPLREGVD